jgi:acyl phosphate:glycerol-3-phosphate acyltransferase
MNYLFSILIGYLTGSIPTAYLFLKQYKGIDITQSGSGNVGTLNSYEVSKSKIIGVSVLLVDLIKGLISVLAVKAFISSEFSIEMVSLIAAVFGHSYSPWIKFKGGRGLATAAGGMLAICLPVFIIWVTIWIILKIIKSNIHIANVSASVICVLLCVMFAERINLYSNPPAQSGEEFVILVSIMFVIILIKHINPLIQLFYEQRKTSRI